MDDNAGAEATVLDDTVNFASRLQALAEPDSIFLSEAQLLAVVVGNANIYARLTAMQELDLVRRESKLGNYSFKHALVRDALYQSLLSEPRKALHLRIAEEIERRSGNRLIEVAETLAHHYSQTDRTSKAFAYLSMAGNKSLSVYSLDEATAYFSSALAFLDKNPDCASDT